MSALLSFPEPDASGVQALTLAPHEALRAPPADFISIRGVRLVRDELVNRDYFSPEARERLRAELQRGQPFPHLVLENLFAPKLLELVAEEFDVRQQDQWFDIKTRHEQTRRSRQGAALGPASQLYFDILHSGWFMAWLSDVTGVPYLLADPKLTGGGLHESQTGATFAIHRDFNRHRDLGLNNEMVFITYLNKGWQPEWGSALELWDKKNDRCVTTVQPEFGRTIIMPHSAVSYHGHTKPLNAPDGRPRRSVAAYFYTSPGAGTRPENEIVTVFMNTRRVDRAKIITRMIVPPALWALARKAVQRGWVSRRKGRGSSS